MIAIGVGLVLAMIGGEGQGGAVRGPATDWLVLPGIGDRPGTVWRYTVEPPVDGWERPEFDDRAWAVGRGGFGVAGMPNAVRQTPWETPVIALRTRFVGGAAAPTDLRLTVYHDEDLEVFVNGVLALRLPGREPTYRTFSVSPEAARAIHPGPGNVLAVRCRRAGGGQFVDVGLGRPGAPTRAKPAEHGPPIGRPPAPQFP